MVCFSCFLDLLSKRRLLRICLLICFSDSRNWEFFGSLDSSFMDQFNYQEFFDMILHWIIKTFVSVLQRVGILDVMDKNRERLLIVFFNGFVLHLDTLSGFWYVFLMDSFSQTADRVLLRFFLNGFALLLDTFSQIDCFLNGFALHLDTFSQIL
ncbi:unnamed protein product [Vicia faba]|uniref:Uncharacterized protein n=1 Tax=Vicia faba TaxID=3906 RepID=A0AAV0ZNI1_VICFA|nr:unnamed protein product [Vicia faba]